MTATVDPTTFETMAPTPANAAPSSPVDATVDIADRVRRVAAEDPTRVALIHARAGRDGRLRTTRHTYRELSDRAESLAVGLREIGVREGTLCSFMVPPGIDAMVLGIALWRIGAVVVGIEPHSHGLRRVARCLAKVGPEVFFGTPRAHAARLAFGWGRGTVHTNIVVGRVPLPGMRTLRSLERHPAPADPQGALIDPADPAVIAFTTGSTGAPKPTVLRQRNLAAMMALVLRHWDLGDGRDVVDMPTFPMFWIIGLSAGGTVVVPPMDFTMKGPGDADPARLVRTIEECGVTSMFASPALLTNLARYAKDHDTTLGLRRIVAGGAEVPGPLFAAVRDVLRPGGEIYSDYGATEAIPVTEIAGAEVVTDTWNATERGAGVCVGRPLPGVDIRIVAIDDDDIADWSAATELPAGEIGEVVARSPHISENYYEQPTADAANKIPDGDGSWHRLGDTGYLDDQGRLWVCGRRSHRVVSDRGTTYPLCCEPVFNAHPAVARSALVGVADGARTRPVICVELELTPDAGVAVDHARVEADLLALARSHRATDLVERVHFMDRLPVDRRHNAKIDRPRIAAEISSARQPSRRR
jgi:acyl-CoA synthetase (AMP-forming)/AMP-acid ligase II